MLNVRRVKISNLKYQILFNIWCHDDKKQFLQNGFPAWIDSPPNVRLRYKNVSGGSKKGYHLHGGIVGLYSPTPQN
jgi:hypothetical protein